MFKWIAVLAISALSCAQAAQDCEWLSEEEFNTIFREYAPWKVEIGGSVGRCMFSSNEFERPNIFSISQQFKLSEAEAKSDFADLQTELSKDYLVTPIPGLGDSAFNYRARPGKVASKAVWFVTRKAKVIVMAQFMGQSDVNDVLIGKAEKIITQALLTSQDEKLAQKASECPLLPRKELDILFGKAPAVQVFGENSCLATEGDRNLVLTNLDVDEPQEFMERARGDDCQHERVEDMGEGASISFGCQTGHSVTLQLEYEGKFVEYSWTDEFEANAEGRAKLIALARAAIR
jgi:hypothetical protein